MSIGTLCELCHSEVESAALEKRYVARKMIFMNICETCRKERVTFSVEEWTWGEMDNSV